MTMNNEQREQQMMAHADAYAEEIYKDEPDNFDTDEKLCETINDYCAGWRAADNSRWIPVEENPKVDISCTLLVHYVDGTIDICDYYGDFYDYTGENVTRNVTHWMPMPEAPTKEGGQEDAS